MRLGCVMWIEQDPGSKTAEEAGVRSKSVRLGKLAHLCAFFSLVCLSAAQFQKLKENQNFVTILFNISLLGDRGHEDRNSRRGRESELHRQTRKLETRAKKSKKDTTRYKETPQKKKNNTKTKHDSKIEAEWLWNCRSDDHQNPILHKPVSMKHRHWNLWLKKSTYFNILITIKIL